MIIYFFISAAAFIRRPVSEEVPPAKLIRLLLSVLAAALMARMVLNGRIYQFGFYQASLAGLLVPAILLSELPLRLGLGRCGRIMITTGCLALFIPGVLILAKRSQDTLRFKTMAIGQGADRFYAFPADKDARGEIVRVLSESLAKKQGQTLVVLPEGVMINYLARLPSPVSGFYFYSAVTRNGREEEIVAGLQRQPPDIVAIVSRDLREYGIQRYGENPGSGQQILTWVANNYTVVGSIGGDPLDYRQRGGMVLTRKHE